MKKLLFILTFFFVNYSIAQTIGSKVSFPGTDGKTYTGVITNVQSGRYQVKYDGYDFSAWLNRNQFTILNAKNEYQSTPTIKNVTTNSKIPEMNGALPKLPGTAWLLVSIIPKGTIPKDLPSYLPYLFLANGRWETQYIGRTDRGTYQVQGNKLVQTRDGINNINWVSKIKWNAADFYLDLEQSDVTYRLHYNTKTTL